MGRIRPMRLMKDYEQEIKSKLKKLEPSLALSLSSFSADADDKVFDTCIKDYINFLKARNLSKLSKQELGLFVTLWFGQWKRKVKLIFKDRPHAKRPSSLSKHLKLSKKEKEGLLNLCKFSLIENNSIVCTEILSKGTVSRVINQYLRDQKTAYFPFTKDRISVLLTLAYEVTRLSRYLAKTKENLVFLKVEKSYYRRRTEYEKKH